MNARMIASLVVVVVSSVLAGCAEQAPEAKSPAAHALVAVAVDAPAESGTVAFRPPPRPRQADRDMPIRR